MANTRRLQDLPASHVVVVAGATVVAVSSAWALAKGLPLLKRNKAAKGKSLFTAQTPLSSDAVALDHLLGAFGPDGRNAVGTAPGCMVASPSKASDVPQVCNGYYFQWSRDTGLCTRSLLESLRQAEEGRDLGYSAAELERRMKDFIIMNLKLQHLPNPSGTFETGGIGEPKFEVDGTAFEGSWGRPQNDGPAVRSITCAKYMQHILDTRPKGDASVAFVLNKLWAAGGKGKELLIRDDLDYICREWRSKSFELWEEVCADASDGGGHFHVLMTQRLALLEGAKLASRAETKDEAAAKKWAQAAADITEHIEAFWNPDGKLGREGGPEDGSNIDWHDERHLDAIPKEVLDAPHVVPTLSRLSGQHKPTQADCAVLLAFNHGWDGDFGVKKDDTWEPWGERCLATLHRNVEVFAAVYPVNKGRSIQEGVVCGRYPEDVFDGIGQSIGNPWFLTTFAVANVLYLTVAHYATTSLPIRVSPLTRPLFAKVCKEVDPAGTAVDTFHRGSTEWEGILRGLRAMAEAYLVNASRYADASTGKMSEQIDRYSGKMKGANELTWSFASLLAAQQARYLAGAAGV